MKNSKANVWSSLRLLRTQDPFAVEQAVAMQNEDPELVVDTENPSTKDVAQAFRNRYGKNDTKGLLAYRKELGQEGTPIDISSKVPSDADGYYAPSSNKIVIRNNLPADRRLEAIAHEYMHAADKVAYPLFQARNYDTSGHFRDFPGDETQGLYLTLTEQDAIERGWPKNPQVVNNMPWLNQVQPLSSNRLANPWAKARGLK